MTECNEQFLIAVALLIIPGISIWIDRLNQIKIIKLGYHFYPIRRMWKSRVQQNKMDYIKNTVKYDKYSEIK